MALPVILNELSYREWAPDASSIREMIGGLAGVMKAVVAKRPGSYLLSDVRLSDLGFINGEVLRAYVRDNEVKENLLFLFSKANRAPFSVVDVDIGGLEVQVNGQGAIGAAYCVALSGLLASVPTSEDWRARKLRCSVGELTEEGDDLTVTSIEIWVPNASIAMDLVEHSDLLIEPDQVWADGADLWNGKLAAFPHIDFCDRVEDDLMRLNAGTEHLRQVADRLAELQGAAKSWRTEVDAFPIWRSYVTGEGETRKRLCEFQGLDGLSHCYDLHARFTPGAGRIHFRLLRPQHKIEIAYIGEKL